MILEANHNYGFKGLYNRRRNCKLHTSFEPTAVCKETNKYNSGTSKIFEYLLEYVLCSGFETDRFCQNPPTGSNRQI